MRSEAGERESVDNNDVFDHIGAGAAFGARVFTLGSWRPGWGAITWVVTTRLCWHMIWLFPALCRLTRFISTLGVTGRSRSLGTARMRFPIHRDLSLTTPNILKIVPTKGTLRPVPHSPIILKVAPVAKTVKIHSNSNNPQRQFLDCSNGGNYNIQDGRFTQQVLACASAGIQLTAHSYK